MENNDIRWKQRLDNYIKALNNLETAINIPYPDLVQKAGIIQFFEVSFELGWKVLKDYLEAQDFSEVKSPRAAIKKAFDIELIVSGGQWLQALQDWNISAHTYDEEASDVIIKEIKASYYSLLFDLRQKLEQNES